MAYDKKQYEWALEDLDPLEQWSEDELERYRNAAKIVVAYQGTLWNAEVFVFKQQARLSEHLEIGAIELANSEIMKRQDAEALLSKFEGTMLEIDSDNVPDSFHKLLAKVQDYFE